MLSSSSFSSSSSSSKSYEVFLSFYGKDTRGNFTDHLYNGLVRAGIRTFRDNEEVRHGDEIGPVLMKAIQESKISIPVFSENYGFSKWCLKELAEIMECKKNDGQIVWPIFYKVDPSHIRNQTGNFAEAFLQHQENQAKETVDSWRNALKDAGNLKGWDSQSPENSLESDLIRSVVVDVLSELKKTIALDVGNHIIGMDSRVDDVIRLLDLESHDVQYVGICGMGGIGKSTIAKAVFNKISYHFKGDSKGWSFLEDVSSTSQRDGLVKLQNALVYGILGYNLNFHSVSEGINIIKERCGNKKVLIILDNVDDDEQLYVLARERSWFGPGSRIIITSRDRQILNATRVEDTKIYMPEVLDENQSLKLFFNYAFKEGQPLHNFLKLSMKIVRIVGGLPLALRVLGSFLYGESCHDVWESMVDSLKKFPHDDIKKKLQISYDRLNASEKDTFLDIACFFIGMDKEIVIHILEDFSPEKNIKVLVCKSLVSIGDDNMLRMHDLLRDMGREIVRQESLKNAGKRTRLWSHNEALDVLKKCKGTSSIEGLSLVFRHHDPFDFANDLIDDAETDHCLKNEAFKPMSDLRLLQVDGAYFDGNFDALSKELKWLSWKRIPSKCIPSISHLRKLSVLDLSKSMITKDWNGWQHIQKVETLKVLDLGGCDLLTRTPNFSHNTRLQRLVLHRCYSLVTCDESIGCLQKLVYLTLKNCVRIKKLPDSICKLSSLTNLILSNCRRLEKLPKALGDMKSLTELMIDRTGIEELPDSIGSLEKLVRLSAKGCRKLARLPRSMGNLWSLKELKMSERIGFFHYCIPILEGKRYFQSILDKPLIFFELNALLWVSMESLPNLSNFKSLERVHVYHCEKLTQIEGLNGFTLLQQLVLENCPMLQSLPELPPSLTRLDIGGCESMESLPNLSDLNKLEELYLVNCGKITKIEGLTSLSLLQQLHLRNCKMLQTLPELPSSLIKLNIEGCHSMVSMPNLSNLNKLKFLWANNCKKLIKIEGMNGLSLLPKLFLTNCPMLQSLPELSPSLTRLDIGGCKSMESLPNLSDLNKLEGLRANNCGKITKIEGLTSLSLLQRLHLRDCKMLQTLPELPSSLITLNIEGCDSMVSMPNLSNLNKLEVLRANNCEKLQKIEGMGGLSLLQEFDLRNCVMLQSLPELPPNLTRLDIEGCESMESLPNLSNLKVLKQLCLKNWGKLAKIESIGGLSLLQKLDLRNCVMLQSLPELPPTLTRLDIEGCKSMESLPNLSNLKILKHLCLNNCEKLPKIEGMGGLSLLQELYLRNCVMLQSLLELPPTLPRLDIEGCESMESLPNLSNLKILKQLCLNNWGKLAKIESIGGLSLLRKLHLRNCVMLQSLPELPLSLTKLQVGGCMKLSEIEGIIGLSLLKVLHLYDCRELRSLPYLSNLKKLEELLLEGCDNLVEIRGLESLKSLKYFRVLRCNTYIKSLQKCVAQGMLVGAFHGENIQKIYQIPENDENIKGMTLLLVYQTPLPLLGKPFHLKVEAVIERNDGKHIRCCHDLQIEGMTGTDVDGYYSCYFHGLTWFGLPLRKQYIIQVTQLGYLPEEPHQVVDEFKPVIFRNHAIRQIKKANAIRMKKFVIIPEYETREDSQQLEKRIAPLITCTSDESEGVSDDDADPSTWLTLGGGEGQGPISCSRQRGVQRGNKRRWQCSII